VIKTGTLRVCKAIAASLDASRLFSDPSLIDIKLHCVLSVELDKEFIMGINWRDVRTGLSMDLGKWTSTALLDNCI